MRGSMKVLCSHLVFGVFWFLTVLFSLVPVASAEVSSSTLKHDTTRVVPRLSSSQPKRAPGKIKTAESNKAPLPSVKTPGGSWLDNFLDQTFGLSTGQPKKRPSTKQNDRDKKRNVRETIDLPILKQAAGRAHPVKKRSTKKPSRIEDKKQSQNIETPKALKAGLPLPPPLTKWENSDILAARKQCNSVLENVDVTVKPVVPIRFNECGTPAPLKVSALMAIRGEKVTLTPPATLNCAFTARFAKWVKERLQPLAQQHLSSRVKIIHNMASYSCRRRYNNPAKKISEHAKANALDIGGFTLENNQIVSVLKHWGDENEPEKQAFLKAVHRSACESFVVVLGPEANEAHKNHFHFDLGRYPVCE